MGRTNAKNQEMKSIKELDGFQFEIPVYQRGFRWTRQQVKELIDDLYEFSDSSQSVYCLQNVTVCRKNVSPINPSEESIEDECLNYEVIDGQQRLTALWILIMAYIEYKKEIAHIQSNQFGLDDLHMPVYILKHDQKESLTDYVKTITDEVTKKTEPTKIKTIVHNNKDIDSALINDAFEFVFSYPNAYDKLNRIFGDKFENDSKKICLLWNEIGLNNGNSEGQTKYAIERFSNINAGKIPLTESELVKAYFIDSLPENKIAEFSLQWEEMERGLSNDEFWSFISSGRYEETRMDFLFRVFIYNKNKKTDLTGQHTLSRKISEILKNCIDTQAEWTNIVQIYNTLFDWFNDYYFYHMIGLIVSVEEEDSSTIVKDIYSEYTRKDKDEFKDYLVERIRKEKCYKIPFDIKQGDWNVSKPEDILLNGSDDQEISYIRRKELVKPILLLFNISLLINAYNINTDNASERFPFTIYKSTKNPIEIEHINPRHLEGKKADKTEYTASDKKDWAKNTVEIIEDETEYNNLRNEIETANWEKRNQTLIERIEVAARLHDLSNLTLVDKNLNIRYGDNFFIEKRKQILAARFGNPIEKTEKENDDLYYKQSVIFPGTMWVFMRQYTTGSSDNESTDRWNATDRDAYISCIQKSIYTLLKPSNNLDNRSVEEAQKCLGK